MSAKLDFFKDCFRRNLSRIFSRNSREIDRFPHKFFSENPTKFDFFPRRSIRGPVLWTVYVIKVLHMVAFFSLLSFPLLFSFTNVNNGQSWPIVFKKSEGLNYIRNVRDRTKCPVTQGFDRTKPFLDWSLSVDRPLFEALLHGASFCILCQASRLSELLHKNALICY